jgi:pimeloyl-ACP methyl ester carboxylesterase
LQDIETAYYISMSPVSDQLGASFVLIPGAGGMAWYWHQVSPLFEHVDYEAIAVDLPGDDESAGLNDYAEIVIPAIGERSNVILVAQSLGGFSAP